MVLLKDIVEFLDNELGIKDVEDSSNNGLQVEGKKEIKKQIKLDKKEIHVDNVKKKKRSFFFKRNKKKESFRRDSL